MAKGLKTGGRRRGTPNKRSASVLAKVEAEGVTPLDYMLSVLHDEAAETKDRQWAAAASIAYIHPRPMPEPRKVAIELPDTATPQGVSEAVSAVLDAAGQGELAPSEARDMIALLETKLKAIEATELVARIVRLEGKSR
jgi:hypothetical protein